MTIAPYLVLILIAAFFGGLVAQRIRLPLIVGYLSSGVFVSWILSRWTGSLASIGTIAEIGVALLMFTLGLEFSLDKFKHMGEIIIFGSLIQILLTAFLGTMLFPLLGFDLYNSLFLGSVFSLSSTAVVVKVLSDRSQLDTLTAEISIGWLLVQDLVTLIFFIILPVFGLSIKAGNGLAWGLLSFAKTAALSIAAFTVIFFFGRKLVPLIIDKLIQVKTRELILLSVLSFCLALAAALSYFGFSFALGAFLAGVLIASSYNKYAIFSEIRPLRDIFSIIFFVSLGFLLNPQFVMNHIALIVLVTFAVISVKFLVSLILVLAMGYHTKTAFGVGVNLTTVGEFAFILANVGKNQNLITTDTYMIILSVAFFSLIISSPLIIYKENLYKKIKRFLSEKLPLTDVIFKRFDRETVDNEIFSHNDHVIVMGHGRVGKYIAKALYLSRIPYIVIDYNNHIVRGLKTLGVDVVYGDSSELDVLKIARLDKARVAIIAIPDRDTQDMVINNCLLLNSEIRIICRSHFDEDRKKLKSLGVSEIVQPEFEAAITITEKLLRLFEIPSSEIDIRLNNLKITYGF